MQEQSGSVRARDRVRRYRVRIGLAVLVAVAVVAVLVRPATTDEGRVSLAERVVAAAERVLPVTASPTTEATEPDVPLTATSPTAAAPTPGGQGEGTGSGSSGSGGSSSSPRTSGFPNASNTGVPAGVTLRPSGSVTVTANGAVIDSLDVSGSIRVEASDVVIKNTRIRNPGGQAITVNPSTKGLLVQDVEIDGTGNTDGSSAVGDSNYTLRRVDIHHFGEGPRANGNVVIEDSYMHDFLDFIAQGAHQDVIQSTGGSNQVIRGNTLLMNVDGGNAVLMLGTDYGSNLTFDNNLVAGGGYALYGGDSNGWSGVSFTNNRISTMYFPNGGFHGPFLYTENATVSGNVWHESGKPVG